MKKHIYQLHVNGRYAVVLESNSKLAKQRAHLHDPRNGWHDATTLLITDVANYTTPRVLALERL